MVESAPARENERRRGRPRTASIRGKLIETVRPRGGPSRGTDKLVVQIALPRLSGSLDFTFRPAAALQLKLLSS